MRWSLVLLPIFGLSVASPIDSKNLGNGLFKLSATRSTLLEGQLRGLLEDLRSTMLTGTNTIPVLDPLKVDYLTVDDSVVPIPGFSIAIGDTVLHKLSTFVEDELTVARTAWWSLNYRATIDIQIPALEVDVGHYDLMAPVDIVTLFGTGDAKLNIIEPRISGHVIARPSLGLGTLHIRLTECQLKLTLKAFDSKINGLLGGDPAVNAFIDAFLRFFVPDFIELYEDQISDILNSLVLEIGNDFLQDFNLFGILG